MPISTPNNPKEMIVLSPELHSVSLIKFPKPCCFSHWLYLAHSPGQISLPISLFPAPCIFNIHKSSCFNYKTLQGWKTGSPAHRWRWDITVPVNKNEKGLLPRETSDTQNLSGEQCDCISKNQGGWLIAF